MPFSAVLAYIYLAKLPTPGMQGRIFRGGLTVQSIKDDIIMVIVPCQCGFSSAWHI